MSTPLLRFPDRGARMPAMLFGPAAYYAVMAAFGSVAVDFDARWDKRYKQLHRYEIADTRGRLTLTVPVSVPHGLDRPLRRSDVTISRHGQWWKLHRTALESAYGRTPYFEFIIDRFDPLLSDPGEQYEALSAAEFARRADSAVRAFLGLDTEPTDAVSAAADITGFDFSGCDIAPYRQIRAGELGFISGLSVLDLIFNLGPESGPYLLSIQESLLRRLPL